MEQAGETEGGKEPRTPVCVSQGRPRGWDMEGEPQGVGDGGREGGPTGGGERSGKGGDRTRPGREEFLLPYNTAPSAGPGPLSASGCLQKGAALHHATVLARSLLHTVRHPCPRHSHGQVTITSLSAHHHKHNDTQAGRERSVASSTLTTRQLSSGAETDFPADKTTAVYLRFLWTIPFSFSCLIFRVS